MRRLSAAFGILVIAGCSTASTNPQLQAPSADGKLVPSAKATPTPATTAFTVAGRNILLSVNGGKKSVFYIKGIDYAPTQICSTYLLPLNNSSAAIWAQDLPNLRALGANAVKVYNVGMLQSGSTWTPTPINQWLTAAYNKGNKPIYTILSIFFNAGILDNPTSPSNAGAIQSLAAQYKALAKTYGSNPDVLGISIGSEWNQQPYVTEQATWTSGANIIIQAAYQGLQEANAQKILTTSLVDDLGAGSTSTMAEGEKYGFPVGQFAWGYNEYRGYNPPFSGLWNQVKQYTKSPFIVGEWGEPTGYHPSPKTELHRRQRRDALRTRDDQSVGIVARGCFGRFRLRMERRVVESGQWQYEQ
jgi:hypothetical protein